MDPYEQIARQRPRAALLYRLVLRHAGGHMTTFPSETDFWSVQQAPQALAPGTYGILYFDPTGKQLDAPSAKVVFSYSQSIAPGRVQVPLLPDGEDGAAPAVRGAGQPQPRPKGSAKTAAGSNNLDDEWKKLASVQAALAEEDDLEDLDDDDQDDEVEDPDDDEANEEGEDGSGDDEQRNGAATPSAIAAEGSVVQTRPAPNDVRSTRARERNRQERLEAKQVEREVLLIKLQQDIQEKNAEIIRKSVANKEVAEAHTLLGLHRREVVEAQRLAATATKREWDRVERNAALINAAHLDNLETVHRAVNNFLGIMQTVSSEATKKLLAPPPPPPPSTDWTSLGQSLIEVVGKVLVHWTPGQGTGPALPPKTPAGQAQLADPVSQKTAAASSPVDDAAEPTSGQTPAVPPTSAGTTGPSASAAQDPKLRKLAERFASLGDLELAKRLSSPEGLGQLLSEVNSALGED